MTPRSAVPILLALAFAAPASAYTMRFQATGADRPFSGPGCGKVDVRSVAVPRDAKNVKPGEIGTYDDSAVGTVLRGPLAFAEAPSHEDEDEFGDFAVEFYASIDGFVHKPGRAIWIARPDDTWCAGYTGDPRKAAPPRPASRQAHPERNPTYHRGWVTERYVLHATYTLTRKHIFTLDPRGTLRADPPTQLAASAKRDLLIHDITWNTWGRPHPVGHGVVTLEDGTSAKATIFADNLTVGRDLRGCPPGRVFYEELSIYIPKLAERSTDYRVGARCTRAVANGENTIDAAPAR